MCSHGTLVALFTCFGSDFHPVKHNLPPRASPTALIRGALGVWGGAVPRGWAPRYARGVPHRPAPGPPAPGWPGREPGACGQTARVWKRLFPPYLPSLTCGKNVIRGAPPGTPHRRAGSADRQGRLAREKLFSQVSEPLDAPRGSLQAPSGRRVLRVLPRGRAGLGGGAGRARALRAPRAVRGTAGPPRLRTREAQAP